MAKRVGAGRGIPGIVWLLATLLVFFSVFGPRFASLPNFINIGTQSATLLLLALPMTLIIMTEGLDLSMGAVLGLSGIVLAHLLISGVALPVAIAAALGVGALFGIANGALVVGLGLPPFVATLGTLGIAQGIALVATNGDSIVIAGTALPGIYSSRWLGVPFSIILALLVYAVFHLLLYHTRIGTYVFALGGNREALLLSGVHAYRYQILIYAIGGIMAGAAAFLQTGRMNSGHPTATIGMEFDVIVAVIVGGTKLERGDGWLPGSVLGVLTVGVLRNGLNIMAVPSSLQIASIGLLVIVALLIDALRGRS